MTVGELIKKLQECNPDLPVRVETLEFISEDTGYENVAYDVEDVKNLETWVSITA